MQKKTERSWSHNLVSEIESAVMSGSQLITIIFLIRTKSIAIHSLELKHNRP